MLAEITNADRASWALSALEDFTLATKVDDATDAVADLIADLLHLARARGLDPNGLVNRAVKVMQAEVEEDEDGDLLAIRRRFEALLPG
jgi:phage terminase small subunit